MADITQDINYPKIVWEQLRRWRIVRAPLLAQLDIDMLRAYEDDSDTLKNQTKEKKQMLRDITKYDFSQHSTVKEVIEYWHTELLGPRPPEFEITRTNERIL